jgi:hypothetical protein
MATTLPDFLIIGAPKAATSWLAKNLRRHEKVFMPPSEIHYFSRSYDHGLDWYASLFASAQAGQIVGEKSATYLASPQVPERVAKLLPNARLIAQLRNPIERAYSDYCMLLRRGTVNHRIGDYLDPARAASQRFIADGEYGKQLSHWLCFFPREQLEIILYDEISRRPIEILTEVSSFLGLESVMTTGGSKPVDVKEEPRLPLTMRRALSPLKAAVAPYRGRIWFKAIHSALARPFVYPPLGTDLRNKLADYYRNDVINLEKILGRTVPLWLEGSPT